MDRGENKYLAMLEDYMKQTFTYDACIYTHTHMHTHTHTLIHSVELISDELENPRYGGYFVCESGSSSHQDSSRI